MTTTTTPSAIPLTQGKVGSLTLVSITADKEVDSKESSY